MWLEKVIEEIVCEIAKREFALKTNWKISNKNKLSELSARIEKAPTVSEPYFLIIINDSKEPYKVSLTTLIDTLDHNRSRFIMSDDDTTKCI